jgi:peptide/nickel transport system substrate-binding protein
MLRFRGKVIGGVTLAVASITVLAACSSSSGNLGGQTIPGAVTVPGAIGSVPPPPSGGKIKAGTITWALQPGTAPTWILPVVPAAANSVFNNFTFIWEMWRPLYWTVNGVVPELDPSMSIANPAVYSNGNKTVTISLKSSYKWSNGRPITADDLLFYIDLVKAAVKASPANWAGYTSGHFPDNLVSTAEPSSTTLVMNLKSAVNPTWFTENVLGQAPVIPLPSFLWAKTSAKGSIIPPSGWTPAMMAKIFTYLSSQGKSLSSYATNPLWKVVDGPYKLSAYTSANGAFTMTPNTSYGGPHVTPMSSFSGVPFTSTTQEFTAITSGGIDVANVDATDVPQLPQVLRSGYHYFGAPRFGMTFANYNFKDTTNHFNNVIAQLYFRQALAHLVDQQSWITTYMHGAGAPAYGPIPALPRSPDLPSNAATNPYPFSISTAVSLLKSHGWNVVPGGTDACAKPGTGAGECGAGIPAGTQLVFNYVYNSSPALIGMQATDFMSKAKQAGITIKLQASNFNAMIANYLDPYAPANENKWAMQNFGGETDEPYATTFGLFNNGGANQVGDYSDPTADSLINASISSDDPTAVKAEAAFLTTDQPVQFEPNPDYIWAWNKSLSALNPQAWENLTQYYATPEFWYFNK